MMCLLSQINVFASGGLAYTDRPSNTYFVGEGSALNFLGGVFFVF
jgi:hypothetical protein